MTIQELKDRKEKLEAVISSSIKAFELETGVTVDGVYFSKDIYVQNNICLNTTEENCPLSKVYVRIEI